MLKRISSLLLLFLMPLIGLTQSYKKLTEQTITNRVYLHYQDSVIEAYIYKGDKKVKPKEDKQYYWIAAQDVKRTVGNFSGKLLHGEFVIYYTNKDLHTKGFYKYGLKSGKWTSWYPKGNIKSVECWKDGRLHGKKFVYHSSGTIQTVYEYKKDKLHGDVKYYDDSLNLQKVVKYKNGSIIKTQDYQGGKKVQKEKKQHKIKEDVTNKSKVSKNKKEKTKKSGVKIYRFRQILPGGQGA